MVAEMFELMYEARGIGLAANQVDLPFQLFIINLEGDPTRGQERVFVNPVISQPKGVAEEDEGCLSLAGITAPVTRPQQIKIAAYDLSGNLVEETASGLLARALQHENDHLNGVLFIDRLTESSLLGVRDELIDFEEAFQSEQQTGEIPSDQAIMTRLKELQKEYCE